MLGWPFKLALARTYQVQMRRMPASFAVGITSGDTTYGLMGGRSEGAGC